MSNKSGQGIAELRSFLVKHANSLRFVEQELPASYAALIQKLQRIEQKVVGWRVIEQLCKEADLDGAHAEEAVEFASHLGVIHYFSAIEGFRRKFVVRNPQWIVDVVKRIISARQKAIDAVPGGVLDLQCASQVWREEISIGIDVSGIIELCVRMRLAFPIDDGKMIVPFQLARLVPDSVPKLIVDAKRVYACFQFADALPVDIFPHLIASNSVYVRLAQGWIWQSGCVLANGNTQLSLVKRSDRFDVAFKGEAEEAAVLFGIVQATLQRSTAIQWPGLKFTLKIMCPECKKPLRTIERSCLVFV